MRSALLTRGLAVAAVVLASGIAAARDLARLPADSALRQSGDSPGQVVFSHRAHLAAQARPDCTACHPRLAPMLGARAASARELVTHEKMGRGRQCGACHDGKAAHGVDDCASCHKS